LSCRWRWLWRGGRRGVSIAGFGVYKQVGPSLVYTFSIELVLVVEFLFQPTIDTQGRVVSF
jgi:hypothetical protein